LIHVPIDRPAILRNAEKLLRQGKLDQAIAEYLRIVEDQPSDWNTANVLGDVYVRAGKPDRAVEQFVRIADHLYVEGFLPKAAAVYKKVLKLKPDHEHAILQAADIAGRQGLLADARALFNSIADRRRGRGDDRGLREIVVRLGTLDPNDFEARLNGARARVALDDLQGAVADLRALAAYMQEKERPQEARQALQEAAALDSQGSEAHSPTPVDDNPRLLLKAAEAHLREGNRVEGLPIGEENPDEVIALRLSGEAPFTSTEAPPAAAAEPPAPFNLDQIFEEVAIASAPPSRGAHVEVDLNVALDELKRHSHSPEASRNLEKPTPRESADGEYRLGLSLFEAGRVDEALVPLQSASRTQGFRFVAASLLGRIFRDQGAAAQAIEWFERAAQAPAPTPGESHQLLFDLAQALEDAGETSRALAICMELQADAGNYRDVAARIDRLANVRARG
jgi:tetratricopeptide (TPR) repeat protein